MKKLATLLAITVFAVSAFAQNPVGTWKGKVNMDMSNMPKPNNPQEQEMMNKVKTAMQNMVLTLKLNSNKTFSLAAPSMMGMPARTAEGKWSQKGSRITLTLEKDNGKKLPKTDTQDATIDAAGKKITFIPKANQGPKMTVTFTK